MHRPATAPAKVLYRTIRVTADVEHIFNVESEVTAGIVKAAIDKAVTDATEGDILSGATFKGMYWTSSPQPSLCFHLAQSQRALMSPDALTLGPGMYFIIII